MNLRRLITAAPETSKAEFQELLAQLKGGTRRHLVSPQPVQVIDLSSTRQVFTQRTLRWRRHRGQIIWENHR